MSPKKLKKTRGPLAVSVEDILRLKSVGLDAPTPSRDITLLGKDDKDLLDLDSLLRKQEYSIKKVASAELAIPLIKSSSPHVLLLSGENLSLLTQKLINLCQTPEFYTPILVTGPYHQEDLIYQAFESGAHDYIATPLQPPLVQARIQLAFERQLFLIEKTQRLKDIQKAIESLHDEIARDSHDALLQHHLAYLAYYDSLTHTVNRQFFVQHLEHLIAQNVTKPFALMAIDLDGFKNVNDTYGHATGDWLLQQVAERLKNILRQGDLICRFGGDEFVILFKNITDRKIIEDIANRALGIIASPFHHDDASLIQVGASVGIAKFPKDGNTADELMQKADAAMYHIKQNGKMGYSFAQA